MAKSKNPVGSLVSTAKGVAKAKADEIRDKALIKAAELAELKGVVEPTVAQLRDQLRNSPLGFLDQYIPGSKPEPGKPSPTPSP